MKKTDPKSFAEIYAEAVEMAGMTDKFAEQQASYVWTEVVGPGVNRMTTRRYVENGVLHVYIVSSSLKNELFYHRSSLIENINSIVGKNILTDIIFH